jgi:4'-phosphopantetheinyl transferase
MENGEKRWLVDTSKWNPSPNDFSLALYVLPRERLALSPGFVSRNSLCILKKIVMSFFLPFFLVLVSWSYCLFVFEFLWKKKGYRASKE